MKYLCNVLPQKHNNEDKLYKNQRDNHLCSGNDEAGCQFEQEMHISLEHKYILNKFHRISSIQEIQLTCEVSSTLTSDNNRSITQIAHLPYSAGACNGHLGVILREVWRDIILLTQG